MIVEFGVAKNCRYGDDESDETTEIIERPTGGQTVVYCGGKRCGRKTKMLSSVIANRVLKKTTESFRDSSAIKYVSDEIHREFSGEVSGSFCMFSADFDSETIVVSRCTDIPVYYYQNGLLNVWSAVTNEIGSEKGLHPSITEIPIEPGTAVVMLSEGILQAGSRSGKLTDITELIQSVIEDRESESADQIADFFLGYASQLDENKPQDDMTAIVIKISSLSDDPAHTRRMLVTCPVPKYQSIFD